ncbi:MAG: hypothetical protein ACSHX6_02010 [Akkermansiaceae bacterium]
MKYLLSLFNLLAGLILVRFTISKFAAWPISVAAFEEMAKPLGIDPTLFRISTGFVIGFASLAFLVNAILILSKSLDKGKYLRLFTLTNLYSLGAMTGALFSEFFLRTEPKMMLVYIALAVIAVAATNLSTRYKQISVTLQQPKLA